MLVVEVRKMDNFNEDMVYILSEDSSVLSNMTSHTAVIPFF